MAPQDHIKIIIRNTFAVLRKCYDNQENSKPFVNKGSRLIFPMYGEHRNKETRISEQELRFVFVEEFNKYCDTNGLDWFYSIETPTTERYIFTESESSEKTVPRVADEQDVKAGKGESASFDLVIFDAQRIRIALIEFKALNPDRFAFEKDFEKLKNVKEGDALRYFIMVLKNHSKETINSIQQKIANKGNELLFYCYSLEGDRGKGIDLTNQF